MTRLVLAAVALAAVYCLTLASAAVLDVAAGLVLAVALLAALRIRPAAPEGDGPGLAGRALAFPAFAGAVLADVTLGTWDVALRVLHARPVDRPGIVVVPFGERSELGVAVTGLVMSLSPGAVLVDIDRDRRVMLVHTIDATDPEAFRARLDAFYRRWQRPVFP